MTTRQQLMCSILFGVFEATARSVWSTVFNFVNNPFERKRKLEEANQLYSNTYFGSNTTISIEYISGIVVVVAVLDRQTLYSKRPADTPSSNTHRNPYKILRFSYHSTIPDTPYNKLRQREKARSNFRCQLFKAGLTPTL